MFDGVVGRERGGKLDRAKRMFGPTLSVEIREKMPHSTTKPVESRGMVDYQTKSR